MFDVLRAMVSEELSRTPAFAFGRVDQPTGLLRRAAFRGGANLANGVRNLTGSEPLVGENGMFIHLGDMQAAAFWRSSHVNVGGFDPPVISV